MCSGVVIVFRAGNFRIWILVVAVRHLRGPWRREGARIVYRKCNVKRIFVAHVPAFDDVQLICVRSGEDIDPAPLVDADRIDHKRVAFPVSHGIAKPTRFQICGMLDLTFNRTMRASMRGS